MQEREIIVYRVVFCSPSHATTISAFLLPLDTDADGADPAGKGCFGRVIMPLMEVPLPRIRRADEQIAIAMCTCDFVFIPRAPHRHGCHAANSECACMHRVVETNGVSNNDEHTCLIGADDLACAQRLQQEFSGNFLTNKATVLTSTAGSLRTSTFFRAIRVVPEMKWQW